MHALGVMIFLEVKLIFTSAGGKYFTNADIYGSPSDDDRNSLQLGPAKAQTMKLNRREGKKVSSLPS